MRAGKAKRALRANPSRKSPRMAIPASKTPSTAIVVAAPPPKPWLLSQDEVSILKNAVCKGASDEELKYCLAVARRFELDPFQQQIWFVPRWDSKAESSDGKEGGKVYVPVVGINGLQHVAARDHADYGSVSQAEYGPPITVKGTANKGKYGGRPYQFDAPEWARVKVFKKGSVEPTIGEVWWAEIYPDVDFSPLVRRMPRLMLAKCARAQAIRIAYPKTGGLLIAEETHTREFTDITPGGRVYSTEESENVHLSAFEQREQEQLKNLTSAQREVVKEKMNSSGSSAPGVAAKDVSQSSSSPAQLVAKIISYPSAQDGDCEISCDEITAKAMGMRRAGTSAGVYLIKHANLKVFYDQAKRCGVKVEESIA